MSELPDCAEVYFHDGRALGPKISLASVGDQLPQLIIDSFLQLLRQGSPNPTYGQLSAMLVFQAVATGNSVLVFAPPIRNGLGNQINVLHSKEFAPGGIGVVLIDLVEGTCTTYGGRGFPDIAPGNPFMPTTFPLAKLSEAKGLDVEAVDAPPIKAESEKPKPKKKAAAKKKAAKKKPAKKQEAETGDETVSVG